MSDENIYERLAGSEMSFAEAQVRLARAHGMRPAAELGDFVGINAWPERAREYLRLFFAAPRPDDWETALFAEILVDAIWSLSESDSSELEGCNPIDDNELDAAMRQLGSHPWTAHPTRLMARVQDAQPPSRFARSARRAAWFQGP